MAFLGWDIARKKTHKNLQRRTRPTRHAPLMDLTDEQRRRVEENRARARDRLRERRLGQSRTDSENSGGRVDAAGGASDVAGDSANPSGSAPRGGGGGGGATGRRLSDERGSGVGEGGGSGLKEGGRSGVGEGAGSGEKGPRGTRVGGGGRGDGSARGGGVSGGGSGESPAVAAAASCEGCGGAEGDGRVDKELLEGFGVSVCRTCKLSREEFQCVPKKEAKESYLLPEGTIAVLKFIERDNPHHASWTKMKLYLRRDVASYSYKRWGGEDGLAAEKSRRDELKYDRSLARTKDIFKRGRSTKEDSGFYGGFLDDYDEN